MHIHLYKLSDLGFTYKLDERKETIVIWPDHGKRDGRVDERLREAASMMGFNEIETDTLTCEAHRLHALSALRKCSELI